MLVLMSIARLLKKYLALVVVLLLYFCSSNPPEPSSKLWGMNLGGVKVYTSYKQLYLDRCGGYVQNIILFSDIILIIFKLNKINN